MRKGLPELPSSGGSTAFSLSTPERFLLRLPKGGKNEGNGTAQLSAASGSPWQLGAASWGFEVGIREGGSFVRLLGSKTEITNQSENLYGDVLVLCRHGSSGQHESFQEVDSCPRKWATCPHCRGPCHIDLTAGYFHRAPRCEQL